VGERSGRGREVLVGPEVDFLSLRDMGGVLESNDVSEPVELELEVDADDADDDDDAATAKLSELVVPPVGDVDVGVTGTAERDACERLMASAAEPGRTGTNCR